jgi:type IV secretion system protein VirB9
VAPGDNNGKERLEQTPVFVPAADVKDLIAKLQMEADTAKTEEQKARKAVETEEEAFKSHYPGTLHFDYTFDQTKAKSLGLQQVWWDDKFTYLRGNFQETPALYEVKDGKGSLINYDFSSGLFTVPKTLQEGYLAIGKQKVTFRRTGGGN